MAEIQIQNAMREFILSSHISARIKQETNYLQNRSCTILHKLKEIYFQAISSSRSALVSDTCSEFSTESTNYLKLEFIALSNLLRSPKKISSDIGRSRLGNRVAATRNNNILNTSWILLGILHICQESGSAVFIQHQNCCSCSNRQKEPRKRIKTDYSTPSTLDEIELVFSNKLVLPPPEAIIMLTSWNFIPKQGTQRYTIEVNHFIYVDPPVHLANNFNDMKEELNLRESQQMALKSTIQGVSSIKIQISASHSQKIPSNTWNLVAVITAVFPKCAEGSDLILELSNGTKTEKIFCIMRKEHSLQWEIYCVIGRCILLTNLISKQYHTNIKNMNHVLLSTRASVLTYISNSAMRHYELHERITDQPAVSLSDTSSKNSHTNLIYPEETTRCCSPNTVSVENLRITGFDYGCAMVGKQREEEFNIFCIHNGFRHYDLFRINTELSLHNVHVVRCLQYHQNRKQAIVVCQYSTVEIQHFSQDWFGYCNILESSLFSVAFKYHYHEFLGMLSLIGTVVPSDNLEELSATIERYGSALKCSQIPPELNAPFEFFAHDERCGVLSDNTPFQKFKTPSDLKVLQRESPGILHGLTCKLILEEGKLYIADKIARIDAIITKMSPWYINCVVYVHHAEWIFNPSGGSYIQFSMQDCSILSCGSISLGLHHPHEVIGPPRTKCDSYTLIQIGLPKEAISVNANPSIKLLCLDAESRDRENIRTIMVPPSLMSMLRFLRCYFVNSAAIANLNQQNPIRSNACASDIFPGSSLIAPVGSKPHNPAAEAAIINFDILNKTNRVQIMGRVQRVIRSNNYLRYTVLNIANKKKVFIHDEIQNNSTTTISVPIIVGAIILFSNIWQNKDPNYYVSNQSIVSLIYPAPCKRNHTSSNNLSDIYHGRLDYFDAALFIVTIHKLIRLELHYCCDEISCLGMYCTKEDHSGSELHANMHVLVSDGTSMASLYLDGICAWDMMAILKIDTAKIRSCMATLTYFQCLDVTIRNLEIVGIPESKDAINSIIESVLNCKPLRRVKVMAQFMLKERFKKKEWSIALKDREWATRQLEEPELLALSVERASPASEAASRLRLLKK